MTALTNELALLAARAIGLVDGLGRLKGEEAHKLARDLAADIRLYVDEEERSALSDAALATAMATQRACATPAARLHAPWKLVMYAAAKVTKLELKDAAV